MEREITLSKKQSIQCPHCHARVNLTVSVDIAHGEAALETDSGPVSQLGQLSIPHDIPLDDRSVVVAVNGEGTAGFIKDLLEGSQFNVISVSSLEGVFSVRGETFPGTVLIDLGLPNMPMMNIGEVMHRSTLILISAGYGNKGAYSAADAPAFGANDYIERRHIQRDLIDKILFHIRQRNMVGVLEEEASLVGVGTVASTESPSQETILEYPPPVADEAIAPTVSENLTEAFVTEEAESSVATGVVEEALLSPSVLSELSVETFPDQELPPQEGLWGLPERPSPLAVEEMESITTEPPPLEAIVPPPIEEEIPVPVSALVQAPEQASMEAPVIEEVPSIAQEPTVYWEETESPVAVPDVEPSFDMSPVDEAVEPVAVQEPCFETMEPPVTAEERESVESVLTPEEPVLAEEPWVKTGELEEAAQSVDTFETEEARPPYPVAPAYETVEPPVSEPISPPSLEPEPVVFGYEVENAWDVRPPGPVVEEPESVIEIDEHDGETELAEAMRQSTSIAETFEIERRPSPFDEVASPVAEVPSTEESDRYTTEPSPLVTEYEMEPVGPVSVEEPYVEVSESGVESTGTIDTEEQPSYSVEPSPFDTSHAPVETPKAPLVEELPIVTGYETEPTESPTALEEAPYAVKTSEPETASAEVLETEAAPASVETPSPFETAYAPVATPEAPFVEQAAAVVSEYEMQPVESASSEAALSEKLTIEMLLQQAQSLELPQETPLVDEIDPKELESAKRLARIIVSDIVLYNENKVLNGIRNNTFYVLLKDDIEEGRKHYNSRVSPKIRERADHLLDAFEAYIKRKKGSLSLN